MALFSPQLTKYMLKKIKKYFQSNNFSLSNFIIVFLAITTLLLGVFILFGLLLSISNDYHFLGKGKTLLDKTAQVGDFIGGFVGSLWSLTGVLLFYLALKLQRKEFKAQRKELKLQRKEIKNQKKEYTINRITNIIYRQQELLEKKQQNLNFTLESRNINQIGFSAQDMIINFSFTCLPIGLEVKNYSPNKIKELNILLKYVLDTHTKAHFNEIVKSILLCTQLINSKEKKKNSNIKKNVLEEEDEKQLLTLMSYNFDFQNLIKYLKAFKNIFEKQIERVRNNPKAAQSALEYDENQVKRIDLTLKMIDNILKQIN